VDQITIKELLDEAANPECTFRRITDILETFEMSIAKSYTAGVTGEVQRISFQKMLVRSLFEQAEKNRPLFPHLFPTIAAICGYREKSYLLANIDLTLMDLNWSLMVNAE
jgi:hypothetical protein